MTKSLGPVIAVGEEEEVGRSMRFYGLTSMSITPLRS
jgi:hypothetical protein